MRRSCLALLLLLAGLVAPSPARAATSSPPGLSKVDPSVPAILGFRGRFGRTPPGYRPSERLERDGVLPVVVRFTAPPDAGRLRVLGAAGVDFGRGGEPVASGAFVAKVGARGLAALAADPTVARVSSDLPRLAPRPLDRSAVETGVDAARRAMRSREGKLLDGAGVKIADFDSGCFVFHPAFFRADAGRLAWVDVNRDGALTPGVDGVDLDGSGAIEPAEVLQVLSAAGVDHGAFDPAVDTLYADTNGNGRRDFGAGFTEATPAYGEPLFVADDLEQDGRVSPTERLLRLGTSKIALAHTSRAYTRGSDGGGILAYGQTVLASDETLADVGHGTGVAGILVGGVPDRTRLLGLAPGADLIVLSATSQDPAGVVASIQWAIDHGADILLTEYAPYTGYPLDGSSEEERILDAAVDKGVAVVKPAGNLAESFKHRTLSLAVGTNDVALHTDRYFAGSPYVAVTLLHRGPAKLAVKLKLPDGSSIGLPAESTPDFIDVGDDRQLRVTRETSPRGTHQIHAALLRYASTRPLPLPAGAWTLSIESDAAVEVDAFAADLRNSWSHGLVFDENTKTRTVCHPATSDKGIAVGAYVLHEDAAFHPFGERGALASYSSSGPRIDGAQGIDLVAPDNPLAPAPPDSLAERAVVGYTPFGGTSGAGPHVAAALALLKQARPELRGERLQAALLEHLARDPFVTDEKTRWGGGKLDVAAALGAPRGGGRPPQVRITASADPRPGEPITLTAIVSDDAPGARLRWDLDDDGAPDTDWSTATEARLTVGAAGPRVVRAEVIDADGYLRGSSLRLDVGAPRADAGGAAVDEGCGCHAAGTGRGGVALLAASALLGAALARRRRGCA